MFEFEYLIRFLLNGYLSPVLFLVYLLSVQPLLDSLGIKASEDTGTNSTRLVLKWYLMLMPGIYLIWLIINFHFLTSFNNQLSIDSFLSLDIHWLEYLPFLFTAVTLKTYTSKSGMEGNVMGFIFFPMLFVGLVISGWSYFHWIWNTVLTGAAA
jgi:hypothetical protein